MKSRTNNSLSNRKKSGRNQMASASELLGHTILRPPLIPMPPENQLLFILKRHRSFFYFIADQPDCSARVCTIVGLSARTENCSKT